MNHAAAAQRRQQLIDSSREIGIKATAARFGVSLTTVYTALRRGQTRVSSHPKIPATAFDVLRRLLQGRTNAEIARELGLSRQRISQITQRAREAGFDL